MSTPQEQQREWNKMRREIGDPRLPCSLMQPIWMVIPPEGIIISCPVHAEGHFIAPSTVTL